MPNTIYFVVEYGPDLEPAKALFPIAEELKKMGYTISIYVPNLGKSTLAAINKFTDSGFNIIDISEYYEPSDAMQNDTAHTVETELLGFRNECDLQKQFCAWVRFLQSHRPSLLIASRSIATLLAGTHLNIKTITFDGGYLLPINDITITAECKTGSLASIYTRAKVNSIATINAFLKRVGGNNLAPLSDLPKGSIVFNLGYEELWPFEKSDSAAYAGAYCETKFNTMSDFYSNTGRPKIFAELNGGGSGTIALLEALYKEEALDVIISIQEGALELSEIFKRDHFIIIDDLFSGYEIVDQVDLVICNGGQRLILAALHSGKPLAIIPAHFEQQISAKIIGTRKLGVACPMNTSVEVYQKYILAILSNHQLTARARAFKYEKKPSHTRHLCDKILKVFSGC